MPCICVNVCILWSLWSINGSLIQRWPCMHFTHNIIRSSWVYSALHEYITRVDWGSNMTLEHALVWNSQVVQQICQATVTHVSMPSLNWAVPYPEAYCSQSSDSWVTVACSTFLGHATHYHEFWFHSKISSPKLLANLRHQYLQLFLKRQWFLKQMIFKFFKKIYLKIAHYMIYTHVEFRWLLSLRW